MEFFHSLCLFYDLVRVAFSIWSSVGRIVMIEKKGKSANESISTWHWNFFPRELNNSQLWHTLQNFGVNLNVGGVDSGLIELSCGKANSIIFFACHVHVQSVN